MSGEVSFSRPGNGERRIIGTAMFVSDDSGDACREAAKFPSFGDDRLGGGQRGS